MNAARLAKIKNLIKPADKIIMAKKDILPLRFPVEQTNFRSVYGKPKGLWYAAGKEWIEWVEREMPHWMGDRFYKITPSSKVLKINTLAKFQAFVQAYGEMKPSMFQGQEPQPQFDQYIDWRRVAKDYPGIEIAPYRQDCRLEYAWYYGWDVASGCIWDKSGIKSIERIYLRKPKATP